MAAKSTPKSSAAAAGSDVPNGAFNSEQAETATGSKQAEAAAKETPVSDVPERIAWLERSTRDTAARGKATDKTAATRERIAAALKGSA